MNNSPDGLLRTLVMREQKNHMKMKVVLFYFLFALLHSSVPRPLSISLIHSEVFHYLLFFCSSLHLITNFVVSCYHVCSTQLICMQTVTVRIKFEFYQNISVSHFHFDTSTIFHLAQIFFIVF